MTGSPLAERAEAAIRRLRDVEGVSVLTEGEDVREVHVVSSSQRAAKLIVRDVQAVLRTELGLAIDHRVVSVALARPEDARLPDRPSRPAPPARGVDAEDRMPQARVEDPPPAREDRIRYENANLIVHGQRTQAQVELRWKGLPRVGNASGFSARDDAHRLVAQATTLAVQEFLADPVALNVREVAFVDSGGHRIVVVLLSLLAHRHERVLTGSCTVLQDTTQAVVLATLDALNRLVAGMRVKEPTEYVLRAESYASET